MYKKLFIVLAVFIFSLAVLAGSAFAKVSITDLYTVGSSGDTTLQDTFTWNEIPWLYFAVSGSNMNGTYTAESWWNDPGSPPTQYDVSGTYGKGTTQVWLSLADWNSAKKMGLWTVDAKYSKSKSNSDTANTSFTVTPEPISSILFLTGGATLGFRRFWKKRMSA